jgi:hypothetical protein
MRKREAGTASSVRRGGRGTPAGETRAVAQPARRDGGTLLRPRAHSPRVSTGRYVLLCWRAPPHAASHDAIRRGRAGRPGAVGAHARRVAARGRAGRDCGRWCMLGRRGGTAAGRRMLTAPGGHRHRRIKQRIAGVAPRRRWLMGQRRIPGRSPSLARPLFWPFRLSVGVTRPADTRGGVHRGPGLPALCPHSLGASGTPQRRQGCAGGSPDAAGPG